METEIELKLAAPAAELPRLERALLDLAPGAVCARVAQTTTYYDTADRALGRRKLALRVREAEGRFVQTVKADGAAAAGLFERGEWEDEIAGNRPEPGAPNSGGHLPQGIGGELEPLFATAVTRTTITLEPSPSLRIEAAIDNGEIRGIAAPTATAPISELELELKHGDPAALFDTALDLLRTVPLRIELRSKAERGFAAFDGAPLAPRPVSAAPIELDPGIGADAALQRIGRVCLAHLLHNEAAALAGDAEGVHQMRVASRRLRAAIKAFKKMVPAAQRERVGEALDRLDAVLGPARNLDVFADELLQPEGVADAALTGFELLADAAERARRDAHARVRDMILSPGYTESVLQLLRWFEARGWRSAPAEAARGSIGTVAPRLLSHRRRRAKKRLAGFHRADASERHKLRIALKELRYSSELLAGLFPAAAVKRFVKPLKKLQDDLGYANDVRVAREVVLQLAEASGDTAVADAGKRVLKWHRRRVARRERGVEKHLRRLDRARPFWNDGKPPHSAAAPSPVGQATPVPPSPQ